MSLMPEPKGATPPPARDDDASSAYSGSSYFSEEQTLPGDSVDDDARSETSASSYESYDSFNPREQLPSYRVPRTQGASQPVYEAWILYLSHETDHEVTKLTSCGIDILSTHDEERPFVDNRTETYDQQELNEMTLAVVNNYGAANKRGFAGRLLRGKLKTYEQDLDERLRKLPMTLQSNLNGLLRNREEATSNRFRRRDWTVAMMREQYRYRFANATPEQVKKKGLFKGKDSRRVEYFFVLKGVDGKVAADDKVLHQPREFDNPWKRVDEEERISRERAKEVKKHGKGYLGDEWYPPPRRRSLSPPYNRHGVAPPRSQFQENRIPGQARPAMVDIVEGGRGRSSSRSRSRSRSPYRYRSPTYSPVRNGRPPLNPFVPLPVPMGGLPPLPPTPTAYYAPTPGPCYATPEQFRRFMSPPPCVRGPAGHHHPHFSLPPFDPCMRSSQLHGPQAPGSSWQPLGMAHAYADSEPLPQPDHFPIPVSMHQPPPPPPPAQPAHRAIPYPLEISSPPDSPRALPASAYNCLGGAPPMMMPPPGFPTMEACYRLGDAEFPDDDDEDEDEYGSDGSSVRSAGDGNDLPPPPPAPKPSNLTTPTEFSPASSHRTGSSVQSSSTDGATTAGIPSMEVFWEGAPVCALSR